MKTYKTLCFKTNKQALKNESEIKLYYGSSLISSKIKMGTDERGNSGFFIEYILNY